MPTITVYKDDLYQLAELPPACEFAELESRLALVKGELGARTLDGQLLRDRTGLWLPADQNYRLRIELKDTNRPDLWSVEGIARQLRDHQRGYGQPYPSFPAGAASQRQIAVDPALAVIRPFIAGFYAHSATLDEAALLALIEAQEALTRNFGRKRKTVSIGFYAGGALRFPLHYRATSLGGVRFEPLPPVAEREHWPAGVALTPAEILERHPTGREYAGLLAGMDLVPLLTDATGAVLSLPPIINSAGLGRVTPGMSALLVEATGVELDHVLLVVNILAANLADRRWQIEPVTTHYPYATARGPQVIAPHEMQLSQRAPISAFSRLLGEPVAPTDLAARLQAYGVTATLVGDEIEATIPSYRQDYLHAVDVVEDYAISRGYDALTPTMAQAFTVGHLHPLTRFEDLVRDLLIGFAYEETISNVITNLEKIRGQMGLNPAAESPSPLHGGPTVQIKNVMNLNYAHLRDWVIPSLLEIEGQSAGALYPHRLFEVGEVAVYDRSANEGSRTESHLAALIAEEEASFDAAQSVLYALLGHLGVTFTVAPWQHPSFIEGRAALILAAGRPVGFLGEIAPQVLVNWGIRAPAAALELTLDRLLALIPPA